MIYRDYFACILSKKTMFMKYFAPFKGFCLNPFGSFDTKGRTNSKHVIIEEKRKKDMLIPNRSNICCKKHWVLMCLFSLLLNILCAYMIVRVVSLEMGKTLTTLSYYVWLKELTIVCVLEVLGSKSEHITFFCMDFVEP